MAGGPLCPCSLHCGGCALLFPRDRPRGDCHGDGDAHRQHAESHDQRGSDILGEPERRRFNAHIHGAVDHSGHARHGRRLERDDYLDAVLDRWRDAGHPGDERVHAHRRHLGVHRRHLHQPNQRDHLPGRRAGGCDPPTAVKFFNAAASTGMGKFTNTPTIAVFVPQSSFAGTYTSTLTISVVSGP